MLKNTCLAKFLRCTGLLIAGDSIMIRYNSCSQTGMGEVQSVKQSVKPWRGNTVQQKMIAFCLNLCYIAPSFFESEAVTMYTYVTLVKIVC